MALSLRSGKLIGLGRRTIRRGGGGVHGVVEHLQDLNCSQARMSYEPQLEVDEL